MKNLIPALICLFLVVPSQAGIIYVDADANGANDGSGWGDAYNYLQDALSVAGDGNDIWVAEGTYKPAGPGGSRTATFQLINGVALKGGYAGFGEPDPNARDIEAYETVLSGDLDGNDVGFANNAENSYHVVTGSGTDETAVLKGFSITAGNDNSSDPNEWRGGGMYNYEGSPTLTNCIFSGNSAFYGGGMANWNFSSPAVTNCIFRGNSANQFGGGMYNLEFSSPTLANCTFSGNTAGYGGGMENYYYSSPTITNCTFSGNSAAEEGSGMDNWDNSSPTVTNCTFTGNRAGYGGGGMYNLEFSSPTLTNCTFSGNSADLGGGMDNWDSSSPTVTNCTFTGNSAGFFGGGIDCWISSSPTVKNSILWGNTALSGPQIYIYNGVNNSATVTYSDIQCGWEGVGNIDVDPCFVFPGYWVDANDPNIVVEPNDPNAIWIDGDYHLQSDAGRWDANSESWVTDANTSLCIDAGNPGCRLGDEPNDANNIRINMGAYGGTAEASMPPYDWALLADLTNDGKVDSNDLAAFVNYWLDSGECIPSDLNRNQFVDFADFGLLGQDWYLETSWYTEPCVPDDMVYIPDGEFEMGDHFAEGGSEELPVHAVLLDAFFMSKFEITNSQYCDYLNSTYPGQIKVVSGVVYASSDDPCDYPYCDTHGYDTDSQMDYNDVSGTFSVRTKGEPPRDMNGDPMVEVSWYGAAAYCNWRSSEEGYEACYNLSTWDCNFSKHGYRLPTEGEWEYAARGGLSGKRFPWADPNITHSQANYKANPGVYSYDVSPTSGYHPDYNDVVPYTAPVDSFAANGYGLYDMAGNVWEWCNDWYSSTYYSSSPYDNPTGPVSGTYRVLRGGCWYFSAFDCRVAFRSYYFFPDVRGSSLGFRIVLYLN